MGQYYHAVNVDKMEWISPHDYGNGSKLMEHSWLRNHYVNAVVNLLAEGESWHGQRIVWAGDYMDEGIFLPKDADKAVTLHSWAFNEGIKIQPDNHKRRKILRYMVNQDKGEFVSLRNLPLTDTYNGYEYHVHPLPLLTSSGNGSGGGDYRHDAGWGYIGTWAGDRITAEPLLPRKLRQIFPDFSESDKKG